MGALSSLKNAGFEVELIDSDKITIKPAYQLTDELRLFIKSHKLEIIKELIQLDSANDKPTQLDPMDDRHYCRECLNLSYNGQCKAAWCGEIDETKRYKPMDDLPRRCNGFRP